jgi:3-hydroxy-9,10-secoandrosta-1,3,5(10)-triene-9,17-dione monooxygenase reductase component
MDVQHLRRALGRFTTGVTIISCLDRDGSYVGLTANSFNALSLSPPMVLWSLRETSSSLAAFMQADRFAVNVLAESQVDLSRRFATQGDAKFADGAWTLGPHGAPVLAGCAAVFECQTATRLPAGDHCLFIGQVLACTESPIAPLVYQAGHYRLLGEVL